MILESHSLKTAVARFRLTTPQALRELQTKPEDDTATRQIETLRKELQAIEDVNRADFEALRRLGFGTEPGSAEKAEQAAAAADGAAPPPASDGATAPETPLPDESAPAR
jgi:hypothetical protein